jgi:hypothetical protein
MLTLPHPRILIAGAAVGLVLPGLGVLDEAEACRRCGDDRHRTGIPSANGYGILKVGGYALDAVAGDDSGLEGLYLGIEWGVSPSPFVEMGFTVDWLHRDDGNRETVVFDAPYELPVTAAADLGGTSTNLVPLGGGLRLRMPVAEGRLVPYVSGQLTWDVLRLEFRQAIVDGDDTVILEDSEYFQGWGRTLALGLEANLDAGFGLLFEAGAHDAEPKASFVIDGVPVEGQVDAGGEFARIGMRFAFR